MLPIKGFMGYITTAIDIFIVTYIIYKTILLIRGTRAMQLLKGIVVMVAVWGGAILLNLTTLEWIMSQFFTIGLFAIVVIFQPELRRALEQIGRGRLFSRSANLDEQVISGMIEETVKAVHYLSKRRIGALIVVERETGITDYIETGIKIEAKISSELLINIFIPNTPLHDGAVIVRGEQIMAAGCYLPLSENPFISKELGTRHRAAIGMSEVSDGVCLVVSEETGQVSIATNGVINRDLSSEQLSISLNELLKPKPKTSGSFWMRKGNGDG